MTTAKQQILKALSAKSGATLTVAQARSRFGITNVSARVAELRDDGYFIVTEQKTGKNGKTAYFYRLG